MTAKRQDIEIRQGETFQRVVRWEKPPFIYIPITAIAKVAPVAITAPSHGLVTGWRTAVVSVLGMEEINAKYSPLRDSDFNQVTVLGPDTLTINAINAALFSTYTSGGYLQFNTAEDLTGYAARMTIRRSIGGVLVASFTSGAPDNRIAISASNRTITMTMNATDTAAYADTSQRYDVYDLEMVSPSAVVTTLFYGKVTLKKESTT